LFSYVCFTLYKCAYDVSIGHCNSQSHISSARLPPPRRTRYTNRPHPRNNGGIRIVRLPVRWHVYTHLCRRTPVAAALRYLASSVRGLTELELLDLLSCNDDVVTVAMACDFTDDTKPSQPRNLCRFPHRLWYDIRQELGMLMLHHTGLYFSYFHINPFNAIYASCSRLLLFEWFSAILV